MSNHTPGPWVAGRGDMGTVVDGVTSKWIYAGEQYVAVASGRIEGEWDEVMANAHLIAAAPDLLRSLKEAISFMRLTANTSEARFESNWRVALDAIAKAEGRP